MNSKLFPIEVINLDLPLQGMSDPKLRSINWGNYRRWHEGITHMIPVTIEATTQVTVREPHFCPGKHKAVACGRHDSSWWASCDMAAYRQFTELNLIVKMMREWEVNT